MHHIFISVFCFQKADEDKITLTRWSQRLEAGELTPNAFPSVNDRNVPTKPTLNYPKLICCKRRHSVVCVWNYDRIDIDTGCKKTCCAIFPPSYFSECSSREFSSFSCNSKLCSTTYFFNFLRKTKAKSSIISAADISYGTFNDKIVLDA